MVRLRDKGTYLRQSGLNVTFERRRGECVYAIGVKVMEVAMRVC